MLEELCDNIIKEKDKKECPICSNKFNIYMPFGENPRKNALCPYCGSLERHRLAYLFFSLKTDIFKKNVKLLHFAPETIFANIFSKCVNIDYLPVDLVLKPHVKEQVDMQDIPYNDNSFDFVYTSHVLEHVPDDIKALKEIYRVLKSHSSAIIQVPINSRLSKTLEKEEYNTPELRTKYYGQFDHLRYYGTDFADRLSKCGFDVEVYYMWDLVSKKVIKKYGISKEDQIFECKKD